MRSDSPAAWPAEPRGVRPPELRPARQKGRDHAAATLAARPPDDTSGHRRSSTTSHPPPSVCPPGAGIPPGERERMAQCRCRDHQWSLQRPSARLVLLAVVGVRLLQSFLPGHYRHWSG